VSPSAESLRITSPATGALVAEVALVAATELPALAVRAREALRAWAELGVAARCAQLLRFRAVIAERADEIAAAVAAETGKPIAEAHATELFLVLEGITHWAQNAKQLLAPERIRPRLFKHKRVLSRWIPRGLVGVISPWNFPFAIPVGDAVPALIAGNAVIVKPSELTPGSALLAAALWREAGLPPEIFQVVVGRGDLGAALLEHVDMVMFTGSVATGRRIAMRCGELLVPCSLELGGKDPMIVCADADLERAANACVWGALVNAGQACLSVERVYVEAPVYDEFVRRVEAKVRSLRQSGPGEGADVGSLTSAAQREKVERHVQDALARGATVVTGGKRTPGHAGLFFEPTLLLDVDHSMECMRDETFGPTIPVMRVRDVEQAIQLANDSSFGLGASVFTKDWRKGLRIAERIRAGGVCVNDCLVQAFFPNAPMGGMKQSGIGRRHGAEGIRKYCEQQTLVVDRLGLRSEPFWYPRSRTKHALLRGAMRLLYGRARARPARGVDEQSPGFREGPRGNAGAPAAAAPVSTQAGHPGRSDPAVP
jgi:acyl-CoA reductase-like NAD-dependent aldehyde dehydrogenase